MKYAHVEYNYRRMDDDGSYQWFESSIDVNSEGELKSLLATIESDEDAEVSSYYLY